MSLMENSGGNMVMPVGPVGGFGGSNGMGWGDGSFWIIVLFLFAIMGGAWGNGGFSGGGGAPYIVNNDLQRGFDQAAVTSGISDISTGLCNGFAGVQQSLCNGFAGVNATVANGFAQSEISNNARQMADMQQAFSLQSQLAQCCCDNRLATAQLANTVSAEACADRSAISDALKDVIASNTANTQMILDKMCQQELEALKTQNQNLQTQLNLANLAASQGQQTATLLADNAAQTAQLMPKAAIPAYIVQNPNGCGCASYNGCGCATM